jgi:hypothetical protein
MMVSKAASAAADGAQHFCGFWELKNWARIFILNGAFGSTIVSLELLVLLVNDSEYSQSARQLYLFRFPWCALLRGELWRIRSSAQRARTGVLRYWRAYLAFLVLLVNDSEYSKSARQ